MNRPDELRRQQRRAWIIAAIIIVPGLSFIVTLKFLITHHLVPTGAMIPTIHRKDRVVVNRLSYAFGVKPRIGDVASYRSEALYIFRIVGGPGDTLEMRDNVLFRNGQRQHEPYIRITPDVAAIRSFGPVTVPPDHYFFLGDNRDNANDSRFLGFVSEEQIRGRMIHVFHVGQCEE